MKGKALEILVVEDKESHLQDARAYFDIVRQSGVDISVDYVSTYKEASQALAEKEYSGIITDVFFPAGENESQVIERCSDLLKEKLTELETSEFASLCDKREYRKAAESWISGQEPPPAGVLVVEEAMEKGVPVVMCTDTYHHGYKSEPIFHYSHEKRIKMIDTYPQDEYEQKHGASSKKRWNGEFGAYHTLIKAIVFKEFGIRSESKYLVMIEDEPQIKDQVEKMKKQYLPGE